MHLFCNVRGGKVHDNFLLISIGGKGEEYLSLHSIRLFSIQKEEFYT